MRIVFISILVAFFALTNGAVASAQFNRTLKIGSYGEDVRELQKVLNSDYSTRILGSGPGSPGQETLYFGSLTQNAVVRFQEKYADKILLPNNLTTGTGIVGPSTRATLIAMNDSPPIATTPPASVAQPVSPTPSPTISPTPPPTYTATTPVSPAPAPPTNPNLKNLDGFLTALEGIATKQGSSASEIATMKDRVIKMTATTTDLRATFEKMVLSQSNLSVQDNSFIGKTVATIEKTFQSIFLPQHAQAAATVPFGGALLSAFPCSCSGTWIIYISPLPPSYATILTYVLGSQAFLSYNIPRTSWLLGFYLPGAGVCLVPGTPLPGTPCYPLPSWGKITPIVGSSPL